MCVRVCVALSNRNLSGDLLYGTLPPSINELVDLQSLCVRDVSVSYLPIISVSHLYLSLSLSLSLCQRLAFLS